MRLRRYNELTNREKDVIEQVILGFSNKEVAEILGITAKTVKFHLTRIYEKESVSSRSKLIVKLLNLRHEKQTKEQQNESRSMGQEAR